MADFSQVSAAHVHAAVDQIRREGVPPRRDARSTRVHVDGQTWPAKYVLGLAWEAAHGRVLDPEDYTGGLASARVLLALGFDVDHDGTRLSAVRTEAVEGVHAHMTSRTPSRMVATSVAMPGNTSQGRRDNAHRTALLGRIVDVVTAESRPGDCAVLVLPGGYLRLDRFVGDLNTDARRKAIESADFSFACSAAAAKLAAQVPGAVLVVGVDSIPGPGECADQMAVAWGPEGVLGVGRKVFPLARAPKGQIPESAGMVINASDFGDPGRVIQLPGGHRGVLCSCYDAFGVSDPCRRAYPIERLRMAGQVLHHTASRFDQVWEDAVKAWSALTTNVDTALIAIHGFGQGRSSSMWQRHGIATASAALGGGLAIAGAHFENLPRHPGVQTLAAFGVPRCHLNRGHNRGGATLAPIADDRIGNAMVRWFAWA